MLSSQVSTVFIVEDDLALCNALEWLFKSVSLSTKAFSNGVDFLRSHQPNWSGCILMDIRMPHMSGLEVQKQLKIKRNILPIIFMTGHGDIPLAVRAIKAGAFDFITKPFNNHSLIEQIQLAVKQGDKYKSTEAQCSFVENYANLTNREAEVLRCIVEGHLNKEIAIMLKISISTVEMHRANVMNKLGAKSIVELIKNYTLSEHLITL